MESPYVRATTLTPHDTNKVLVEHDAIQVGLAAGGAMTVPVQFVEGTTITLHVPSGTILPIQVKRVMSTGLTASAVVNALKKG